MSITGSEQWMYSSGREFYDFPIEQSLRFNDDDSAYLSRTPASASNRKTMTFSFWFKRGNFGATQKVFSAGVNSSNNARIDLRADGRLQVFSNTSGVQDISIVFDPIVFRDVSAWYHFTVIIDTTSATQTDRVQLYVNGTRHTGISSTGGENIWPDQNDDSQFNTTVEHNIGRQFYSANAYYDGYLAEVNFIDGQALDATNFGQEKSGIWTPVDTSGLTFGTNGFRLQFGDTTEASGFNAVTYTGNGSSQSISGVGFSSSPDLVWLKSRTNAYNHELYDTVRGVQKALQSSTTNAETTETQGLLSFDSDGFSIGSRININEANDNHIAWAWDAGSGSAASNTDGSITSTVKANTDYGFSIVSYTGTGSSMTFGHGLGVTPDLFIVKKRNSADEWIVYPLAATGNLTQYLKLHTTSAYSSDSVLESATSSVIGFGSSGARNGSGDDYIAYCFAEKAGYSKFSSYTGTGATGNSITGLGFAPAFVMIKRSDSGSEWAMYDNTRQTSNPKYQLRANASDAENSNSAVYVDLDSDGFTIQTTDAAQNASGGTYIYMAFADTRNAAFWRDTSGEGNDWQPNNLVFSDVVPDSSTNNFGTWNPLVPTTGYTFSEGNLKALAGTADYGAAGGMFTPKTGKWYFEFCNSGNGGTTGRKVCGVASSQIVAGNDKQDSSIASGIEWSPTGGTAAIFAFRENGDKCSISATTAYGSDDAQTIGDVVGVALDLDNSAIYFSVNGVWQNSGDPTSGASQTGAAFTSLADDNYTIMMHQWEASHAWTHNGGQDSTFAGLKAAGGNADENGYGDFAYAPPSGFLSLCSANLPSGSIDTLADETPEDYFSTVLWSGNGSTQSITGVGFSPDWVWTKKRSSTSSHYFVDAVRGSDKVLFGDSTDAEVTTSNVISSFDSDGFSIGADGGINASGQTFVGWNWKANGSGVSNTDGSITSTVSVGATSQQNWFSVVGFTTQAGGYTVGHGLGQKPSLIITKNRDTAGGAWYTFTDIIDGSVDYLALNQTSAKLNDPFGLSNPTSSVFSLDDDYIFGSGDCIAYCFANAEGLCKAGSYSGNGSSTDGTFVWTGFRPAFVMWKRTDTTSDWFMMDVKRDIDNPTDHKLEANTSGAEVVNSAYYTDYLSNGFKLRNNNAQLNASGGNYIYLAIAEQPFKYANAR